MIFDKILEQLKTGDLSVINFKIVTQMNEFVMSCFDKRKTFFTEEELNEIINIIMISNILDNNTDKDILPLESGIYDMLIELYKRYRPDDGRIVGSIPVHFESMNEGIYSDNPTLTEGIVFADDTDKFFIKDINRVPEITDIDLLTRGIVFEDDRTISKRQVNIAHNYPNLVGTLSKMKFVLNKHAKDAGVFDDPKVKVFERDFMGNHISMGLINMNSVIRIVAMLKYDGIAVEGDIKGDTLVGARTRGDANNDIAADLTPILEGYHFKHATGYIPSDYEFGMQFEAIMTFENIVKFNQLTEKDYKNGRTAISGLFSRSDAYKYRDLITLVPLRTSLDNIEREKELEFLNMYYHSGVLMKYVVLEGSYIDVLFKLKIFVDEADYMRDYLNFLYDGVVVEYIDEYLINALGRKNSVNQFATAIKFNPKKKNAYITGLSYTVGKDGKITPMIHYTPVEFIGTTHDKSTLHSYDRYIEEKPAIGKIADIAYVNEVMPYVTIPNNSYNEEITELIPYATNCPCCGSILELADSGKNWYCRNIDCKERNVRRMVDFLDVLNLKDFAGATIEKLNVSSLRDLLNISYEKLISLDDFQEVKATKLMNNLDLIKTMKIEEHKIVGGLGFTGMSYTTWEYILKEYTLREVYDMYYNNTIHDALININGIGPKTIQTIINEFPHFKDDIEIVLSMENVIPIKGAAKKITVRFTNCRDAELVNYLNNTGLYDADDKKGVTKTTDVLLIPNPGFTGPSGKYDNAVKNGFTQIIDIDSFRNQFY